MTRISQIDLISGIIDYLQDTGLTEMNIRQHNAIIAAADLIVDAFAKEHVEVTNDMGLAAWLKSDETGISSEYMAGVLSGDLHTKYGHPHDPADFNRCVKLIKAVPGFRSIIPRMSIKSPQWAAVVENWDRWEKMLEDAIKTQNGNAKELYQEMKDAGL